MVAGVRAVALTEEQKLKDAGRGLLACKQSFIKLCTPRIQSASKLSILLLKLTDHAR